MSYKDTNSMADRIKKAYSYHPDRNGKQSDRSSLKSSNQSMYSGRLELQDTSLKQKLQKSIWEYR